ncbi:metallophosphoesterase [Reichenbachiella carrageenanivorans]|uniref:Metallophosphoesterase n=1 Tax=Reichenbachiella carrageenanivorans TaxID=2979869 RepID=A0ABY6D0T0_9BACT|nr:metallophosphoesterase [Reichenbachiella carrageenanivorans]UXX79784.1 metallophosphoesterase [Reichenbachiella carrageenanivorans]
MQEKELDAFLDYLSDQWEQVFIVPGNHESYLFGNMAEIFEMEIKVRPNVTYLNHKKIVIDGVEILFSTLWSHCNEEKIEKVIRDFLNCSYDYGDYKYTHHNKLHDRAVAWLNRELSTPSQCPRIVVSHFVPSRQVDKSLKPFNDHTSMMRDYYVADLDQFLPTWNVDYWIYGHNHCNHNIEIEGVKFVSNMLAYVKHGEHERFNHSANLDLS